MNVPNQTFRTGFIGIIAKYYTLGTSISNTEQNFSLNRQGQHTVLFIKAAICVTFPPGADARSKMRSCCCGAKAITGKKLLAACRIYCPLKYSGVAPSGTCDSNTCRPTFDHFPTGSRVTPRLIRL